MGQSVRPKPLEGLPFAQTVPQRVAQTVSQTVSQTVRQGGTDSVSELQVKRCFPTSRRPEYMYPSLEGVARKCVGCDIPPQTWREKAAAPRGRHTVKADGHSEGRRTQ
eukprot:scaffold49436_cov55-Phaeocystis_antarctica.AAC.3